MSTRHPGAALLPRSNGARRLIAAAATTLLAFTTVSCSEAKSSAEKEAADTSVLREGITADKDAGAPTETAKLRFGSYAEPRSLDPAVSIAAATTGGTEMLNIYDSLMRYDTTSQAFVPQLAENLEPNATADVWTLTLRPNVTFTNGDTLDAAAVVASIDRYVTLQGPESALWKRHVKAAKATGDLTVEFTLAYPWPGFASILSTGPGMIVAEAAKSGEEFVPIGAGPFQLKTWKPQERLLLTRNPDYWDGAPPIAELDFAFVNDQGARVDSLRAGDLDATMVIDPDQAAAILKLGGGHYINITAANNVALINAREGHPGADVRVRQALQAATDPQFMMTKAYGPAAIGSSELFPDATRWTSEVDGPAFDMAHAKKLLGEAMADGYDGRITYLESSEPSSRDSALAVKAQLEAVGFTVKLDLVDNVVTQFTKVAIDGDYDVAAWGLVYRESDPYPKMFATLHSEGNQSYGMHTSPEMDALIEQLLDPADVDATRGVMARIQEQLNAQVPFLNWGAYADVNAWAANVHGVAGASNSMLLLSNAWIK
ncbi:ABC transporter substrate-binding protein [Nocardioides sp. Bht2]|uniref:ABC transporter substrate-binding protein n=1 Tax=Nocardioides sp. Bht2 TaxID=3392297 RepID=UPI0039B6DF3C